ncbi:hypothetical protein EYC80_007785 [Monilinia laxa]|uniref:Uncharacterized protein n=1 Tax=Monilinia laxa TaxID=61186 RepID=A0A5N6JX27_MONLA|nr:hypothetical protein EYC80_007785 [Monilinia laxa]
MSIDFPISPTAANQNPHPSNNNYLSPLRHNLPTFLQILTSSTFSYLLPLFIHHITSHHTTHYTTSPHLVSYHHHSISHYPLPTSHHHITILSSHHASNYLQ